MNNLQQQMERDLAVLKAAFPHLQEQFPEGEWMSWIASQSYGLAFELEHCVRLLWVDFQVEMSISIIFGEVIASPVGTSYSVVLPSEFHNFPTIYAAVEFIGRISRGLTPIDASAEALEARFGGAS